MGGWAGQRFDLHLHSTLSDGEFSPEHVLEVCAAGGLDVVALTDHDLASRVPVGPQEVGGRTITVVRAAEVSGVHAGKEQHLLAYFPHEPPASFLRFCEERCQERAERYLSARARLGMDDLSDPDADALAGRRALTRHHLAHELVRTGRATSVSDAFRRYVGDATGMVPTVSLPFVDAIRIAREAGAVTSWAHPAAHAVKAWLPTFVAAGLQGLETERPSTTGSDRRLLRKAAKAHGLFVTGGSDWHGFGAPRPGLFAVQRPTLAPFLAALEAAA